MTWEVDRRTNSKAAGGMEPTVPVPMDRPAPTLTGKAGHQWIFRNGAQANATVRPEDRPAPTILASADNGASVFVNRQDGRTYKLTPLGALILQSFPADYPVQRDSDEAVRADRQRRPAAPRCPRYRHAKWHRDARGEGRMMPCNARNMEP